MNPYESPKGKVQV